MANALQLPTTLKLDKFINNYVLDVSKVGRCNDVQASSYLEESSIEEEVEEVEECLSDDEHLTEPYSY